MARRETLGDKIGDKIRIGMLQIWADAKKELAKVELTISLDGIPLLAGKKILLGLEPKKPEPK